jgi:CRISPR-associated protein Csb2
VRLDAPLVGLPASPGGRRGPGQRQYPGYKTGSQGMPRACVHAEIEFPRGAVRGPVLIGAGRFMGYGLFLPHETPARARRQGGSDA